MQAIEESSRIWDSFSKTFNIYKKNRFISTILMSKYLYINIKLENVFICNKILILFIKNNNMFYV